MFTHTSYLFAVFSVERWLKIELSYTYDKKIFEKITYKVISNELTIFQKDYIKLHNISGYVNTSFAEIINGKETQQLYFRGYFKTPLKN